MAKRSAIEQFDTEGELEVKDIPFVSDKYLMLNLSTTYKIVGKTTGKQYVWPGAGSVLPVCHEDAEHLLSLVVRRGCCGGGDRISKPVFVEVYT